MNGLTQKLTAVSMAILVLAATISFSVDMHYCGDTLVDFSFVQQVKTCGMDKAATAIACANPTMNSKSCCSDEQLIKQGQEDLKNTFSTLDLEQQLFVASWVYSYSKLFEGTQSQEIPFVDYPPPFVRQDVQVLHQTFLI